MRRSLSAWLMLPTAVVLAGCGGDSGASSDPTGAGAARATSIALVSGDVQSGPPGSTLAEPLVVKVSDAQGNGVSEVTVTWSVTAGGGTLSAASAQTNAQGQASVTYTLGPAAGQNTVTASADDLAGSPVTFTFMATTVEPGPPSVISAVSGDGEAARVSQSLPQPLVVQVSDTSAIGVPGITVTWSVTAGGATLSATSTTTDAAGKTSVTLTLGPNAGTNTVTASVTGLQGSPVTFTATGTLPVLVTIEMLSIAFVAPGGGDAVTILLGDTIQWVNQDAVQHTATSNSQPAGGAAFDSSLLSQGQTFSFVPNLRGTWVYSCQVHPVQMQGATITVQ